MPDPASTEPDAPQATPARETGPGGIETAPAPGKPRGVDSGKPKETPAATPEAQPEPGSQPLPHKVRELFAQLVACDTPPPLAYARAKGAKPKVVSDAPQASRWGREPPVARRIAFLRIERAKRAISPPETPQTQVPITENPTPPPQPRPPVDASKPITRAELVQKLGTLVRLGEFDASTITALLKLMPELTEGAKAGPDPADIVGHLASFAGRSGPDVVREMGGLPFLARRFAEVLRVSLADLAEACRPA